MSARPEGFGLPLGEPSPLPPPLPAPPAEGLSAAGGEGSEPVGVGAALSVKNRPDSVTIRPGGRVPRMEGGRHRIVKVRVSDVEYDELAERAERANVSIQRLLIESTMSSGGATPGERSAHWNRLGRVHRQLKLAGNNLNQVTRWSHQHERAHAALEEAVAEVEAAALRVAAVSRSHTLVPRSRPGE